MTPGPSTRGARSQSSSSQQRSRARRETAAQTRRERGKRRNRRGGIIAAVGVVVAAIGIYALATSDLVGDRLREVTLPLRHEDIIRQQAREKELQPELVAAIIYAESRFRDQESNAGARGLMQITPATADVIEGLSGGSTFETDDLSDPDINIRYGTYYLRYLLDKFDQNLVAALAAYNAGETNVAAWGGADLELDDIEFDETREYVESVLSKREEYRESYAEELGIR
jgi:soluble lytic murein transglycosylase